MCKVMKVHRSGYYQWLNKPISNRELENQKLFTHIKEAYKESNGVYGSRNIHKDLKELGIEETIHLSDIKWPKGVTCVALSHDDNKAVVSINKPKAAPIEEEEDLTAAPEAPETEVTGQKAENSSDDNTDPDKKKE